MSRLYLSSWWFQSCFNLYLVITVNHGTPNGRFSNQGMVAHIPWLVGCLIQILWWKPICCLAHSTCFVEMFFTVWTFWNHWNSEFLKTETSVCVCVRGSARIEQGHPGTASHLRQILQSPQPAQLSFLAAACAVVVPASWVASELALMFQSSAFIKYIIYIYR
jgi:hypothetical protein